MSHKSTIRLLDKLGDGHDVKVHKWKEDLTQVSVSAKIM